MQDRLVYIVNAGNDGGMSSIANDASFPALAPLTLGTWLKDKVEYADVLARDGQVMPVEAIKEEISALKPGIVGVSVLSTSYGNSLEIAQHAKDTGAVTVFGNDQAAHLGRKILEHRDFVDYVVGSEYGERALELLVRHHAGEDISLESIPDVTYRDGAGEVKGFDFERDKGLLSIVRSSLYEGSDRKTALDQFPIPDRILYPDSHWATYLENYMSRFSALHDGEVTGVTTMNRARGCSRASNKCSYCDMLLDIAFSSPEKFWEEVQQAYLQIGANVFYEVCDSFSSFPKLIEGIAREQPQLDFEPLFFFYAQARDAAQNPMMIKQLKEIGTHRINFGLDSGCDQTLKHLKGPHDSVKANETALQMAKNEGIHVYASFVLGSRAETEETLKETVDWVKKIIEQGYIMDVEAQPILPLPNNVQGRELREEGLLRPEDNNTDWPLDIDKLSEAYIDEFSGVSYDEAVAAAVEIREAANVKGINSGSGVSQTGVYEKRP